MSSTHLLDQVTAIIKTFERPKCLDRLLQSIKRFYPRLRVIVCDDGFVPTPRSDVQYIRTAVDIGLSAGRNVLLNAVTTPYFLLLDDDLAFTEETKLERLVEVLQGGEAVLAAGDYIHCKQKWFRQKRRREWFHGILEQNGGHLVLSRGSRGERNGYLLCDMTVNFFVADTNAIKSLGGWDESLKLNEHVDFFLRMKHSGLKAAFCGDVTIEHWHLRSRRYARYRMRDFTPQALSKYGVTKYTGMDGRVTHFDHHGKAA